LLLLLVGQLFLIGTSVTGKETSELEDTENLPAIAMQSAEMESSKKLEEPKSEPLKAVEPAKPFVKALSYSVKISFPPLEIKSVEFFDEKPFRIVQFEFNKEIRFTKVNHEGKFLRMRIFPSLTNVSENMVKDIDKNFLRFSSINAKDYSELLFYGKAKIGEPCLATSAANLPCLIIPFLTEEADFTLKDGEQLAEGLWFYRDRVPVQTGNCDVYILRVNPLSPNLAVFPVLAYEGICQKEILSSMGRRYQALAGINGAYFTPRGDPIGTLIINRALISSPLYNRSVFGISDRGFPLFGNPDFSGSFESEDLRLDIDAVNQPRSGDKLVIYTPEFARSTMTTESGVELVLVKGRVVGIKNNDAVIPPDGVVVSAGGKKAEKLTKIKLGDSVSLKYQVNPPWNRILHAVCGGPRLLSDGKININGKAEKFDNSIVYGRHPRSAVALTYSGELLFVVVDGRSKRSAGMLLTELANYLKKLGACYAINLDGGGSSSMLVGNKIVNRPSDGHERPISNGILIAKK